MNYANQLATPRETEWATEDQSNNCERIDVLKTLQLVLQRMPCRLGDRAFIRVHDAMQDAINEARRDLPGINAVHRRPIPYGEDFIRHTLEQMGPSRVSHADGAQSANRAG